MQPAAVSGVCFHWPTHLRSRSQVEEPHLKDTERDAPAVALSTAELLPAVEMSAPDAPAAVEHATAGDNVDGRHREPPISSDKLLLDGSDSHGGASAVLLRSGAATVAVTGEGIVDTEPRAAAAASEDAAAAGEAAGHVDADETALAVVQAVADPESLVDFPFNSRRGEPWATPCKAGNVLTCNMFGGDQPHPVPTWWLQPEAVKRQVHF